MKAENITDDQVKRVIDEVGMLPYDWGQVSAKVIIAAAVRVVNADNLKTLLKDESWKNSNYKNSVPGRSKEKEIND